jgi:hypothetical protein
MQIGASELRRIFLPRTRVNSATCEWRGGATHVCTRHKGRPKEGGGIATNVILRSSVAATGFLPSATPQNIWSPFGIF